MLGTDWVAPGEGDTVLDLVVAAGEYDHEDRFLPVSQQGETDARTNLRLTDRPIQDYDVSRIEVALRDMGYRL